MTRFICSLASLSVLSAGAQNLLPNGDFEQYSQCPDYVSQIDRAIGWSRPTLGTSDYFNACLGIPFSMNVPDNQSGYEPAHSGNGYAGFYCFYSNTAITTAPENDHEYVTHALDAPLITGGTYSVEFFVSLADVSKYAVNDIGALLSTLAPSRADNFAITATPQITNASLAMLDEKDGWTRIHGCFVADSAFAYITIGNFHVGAATVFEEVSTAFPLTYFSYYYVDDVSVSTLEPPQLGPDVNACVPTTLTVLNPAPDASYLWNTGEVGTTIIADTSGTYSVQLDPGGCVLSDTIVVQRALPLVLVLPTDTTADFCTTNTISIGPAALPLDATLSWSTGETTPHIAVNAAGTYTVTATAPGFCAASAAVQVIDTCGSPVYAPNAFTPNGDGINDRWQPLWTANPGATFVFTVFDRWGAVLFASNGQEAAWDGTANGGPVPSGVYTWMGYAHDNATYQRNELRGHITLLR